MHHSAILQYQRDPGGQKRMKAILNKCSVFADHLETLASNGEAWQDVCEGGLTVTAFDVNYDQAAQVCRTCRHAVTSIPASGPRHIRDRICASEFGPRSHLRSRRPPVS